MEKDAQNIFRSAIKKLIREKKRAEKKAGRKFTQAMVAVKIGVDPDNLSAFLNGHRPYSETKREDLARFFGKTYVDILNERVNSLTATTPPVTMTAQATTTQAPPRQKTDIEIQADKDHQELVGRFIDKKTALKINQLLVRLEELENGDGLKAALEWAEYRVHQAEKKAGLGQGSTGTEGK